MTIYTPQSINTRRQGSSLSSNVSSISEEAEHNSVNSADTPRINNNSDHSEDGADDVSVVNNDNEVDNHFNEETDLFAIQEASIIVEEQEEKQSTIVVHSIPIRNNSQVLPQLQNRGSQPYLTQWRAMRKLKKKGSAGSSSSRSNSLPPDNAAAAAAAGGALRTAHSDSDTRTARPQLSPQAQGQGLVPINSANRASSSDTNNRTSSSSSSRVAANLANLSSSQVSIRNTSIKFQQGETEDWFEDSSHDDSNISEPSSMEVMDLRPSSSVDGRSRLMDTSSLASLSSNMSIDTELASGLFQVASGAGAGTTSSSGGGGGLLRSMESLVGSDAATKSSGLKTDLPKHWDAAAGSGERFVGASDQRKNPNRDNSNNSNATMDNPLGESEQAYRALMSLMRSNTNHPNSEDSSNSSEDGDNNNGNFQQRGSFISTATGASGFWSAIAPLGTDECSSSSSSSSSGSETSSKLSESSPLTRKRRKTRQLYVRRCARAMVGFVAMAALSGCVIYFVVDEDEYGGSLLGVMQDSFWGRFNGDSRKSLMVVDEEEEQQGLGEEMYDDEGVVVDGGGGGGGHIIRLLYTKDLRDHRVQEQEERLERTNRQKYEMGIVSGGGSGGVGDRRTTMVQGQEGFDSYYADQQGYYEPQGDVVGGQQDNHPQTMQDEIVFWQDQQGHPQEFP